MKKTLLFLTVGVALISFSCKKTGLDGVEVTRGGGGSSTGVVHELPESFKRNNGNGTCGGAAQIRAQYETCPTEIPNLTAVYPLLANNTLGPAISLLSFGTPNLAPCSNNNGYISYCIFGGNIPPINKVIMRFQFPNGDYIMLNSEGEPYVE